MNRDERRKRGGKKRKQCPNTECGPSTASTSDGVTSSTAVSNSTEIPGFYFDPERRRYFRILADHLGAGAAGAVTPQVVDQRKRENERQQLLRNPIPQRKATNQNYCLPSNLTKRQLGQISDRRFRCLAWEGRMQVAVLGEPKKLNMPLLQQLEDGRLRFRYLEAEPDGRGIVAYCTTKPRRGAWSHYHYMRIGVIEEGNCGSRDGDSLALEITECDSIADGGQITDMRLDSQRELSCVTYGGICGVPLTGSFCQLGTSHPLPNGTIWDEWRFPRTTVWSCAYSSIGRTLAVGFDNRAKIIDVLTSRKYGLSTKMKCPLVQCFSKDGNTLLMGMRGSETACYDIRSREVVYRLQQKCVSSLHVMSRDDNYLVAGDLYGKIKMWDVRARKPVRTFEGQVNSYTKLPLVVNEENSLLIAGGEDGTTRCWSLVTGDLLCEIASPQEVTSARDVPAVCYSSCWGGVPGNAAIVLGTDKLHFYELWR